MIHAAPHNDARSQVGCLAWMFGSDVWRRSLAMTGLAIEVVSMARPYVPSFARERGKIAARSGGVVV